MRIPSPVGFLKDRRGNVAMLFALTLPVLILGAGFAIDYTHAMQVQTKLDAAADAAVLAALTPAMMLQSNTVAQTAATNMFNAEASTIGSLIPTKTNPTVTVTTPANTPLIRNVTVSYTAANTNIFAGILGYSALQVQGISTATASGAANMNFYLLLDNSPSMSIPSTTAGIAWMVSHTQYQAYEHGAFQGCAFACHQGSVGNPDTAGNPCADGTSPTVNGSYVDWTTNQTSPTKPMYCSAAHGAQLDNYAYAKKNSITLRLDALGAGISDLTTYAEQFRTQQASPPTYKFGAFTMDTTWQIGMVNTTTVTTSSAPTNELMALTTSYVSNWTTASPNFKVMEYYSNNVQCSSAACTANLSGNGGDWATNYDNALGAMNTMMPKPGQGTNVAGDTPKEVLFFVTDGVEDESNAPSCSQTITGTRCQAPITPALCTTIKNRGIYIAILYTDYFPVTANGSTYQWYADYVAPYNYQPPSQSQVAAQLQTCASPGMFIDAGLDSDLGVGLKALFSNVMAAHLTQ